MTHARAPQISPWFSHARVAVSALQAAGIPAIIADAQMYHVYPSLEFGSSRARILIPPSCVAEAREIMAEALAHRSAPIYPCPVCEGETRQRARIVSMTVLAVLGAFIPLRAARRRCPACRLNLDAPYVEPFTAEELGDEPIR